LDLRKSSWTNGLSQDQGSPHSVPPPQITLDLDATDDPLRGHQEEGFFHGYYDNYCYLPL